MSARLTFEVVTPEGDQAQGELRLSARHVTIRSDDLTVLAGGRTDSDLQALARLAAEHDLVISIADGDGDLMRLGAVRAGLLHRIVTRSRHVQVVRWRAAAALKAAVVTSSGKGVGVPPPVVVPKLPPAPWSRRAVTTTHDPYGGGHPRLYLSDTRIPHSGRQVMVYPLPPGDTTLGSAEGSDLLLEGVDEHQAVIERTPEDEYVLVQHGTSTHAYVNGEELPRQRLRTGARVEIGPWRMTYVRDEHADHGRPFGGRIGGELGRQRPQSRPTYQR